MSAVDFERLKEQLRAPALYPERGSDASEKRTLIDAIEALMMRVAQLERVIAVNHDKLAIPERIPEGVKRSDRR